MNLYLFFVELFEIMVDRKRKNDEMDIKMFVVLIKLFLVVSYV